MVDIAEFKNHIKILIDIKHLLLLRNCLNLIKT